MTDPKSEFTHFAELPVGSQAARAASMEAIIQMFASDKFQRRARECLQFTDRFETLEQVTDHLEIPAAVFELFTRMVASELADWLKRTQERLEPGVIQ